MNETNDRLNKSGKINKIGYIVSIALCVAAAVAIMVWKGVFSFTISTLIPL